jgi:hypothetical protein
VNGIFSRLRWKGILLLAAMTPPCRRITELCSLRMEGVRPVHSRWQLPVHFLICTGCRRYLRQLELIQTMSNAASTASTPVEPMGEARKERLRQRLRCERPG